MGKNISPTIEAGVLVAITVMLGLATVFIPLFGLLVEFFFAVPPAILTFRHGAGKGLLALFVTFVLLSMLISPLFSLRVTLSVGLCGVVFGWGVRKNFDAIRIFFFTLMVASAAQILSIVMLNFILDTNLVDTEIKMLRESVAGALQMYETMGIDQAQINETKKIFNDGLEVLVLLIPTLLMLAALLNTLAVYLASQWIFPKLQIKLPHMPPFAEWRFSVLFFYLAAFAILGDYWGTTRGWTEIHMISLNVMVISMLLGLIQGFACLSFVADRFRLTKFFRGVMYVLLLINPLLAQITAIVGLMDMYFDYRKKFLESKAKQDDDS